MSELAPRVRTRSLWLNSFAGLLPLAVGLLLFPVLLTWLGPDRFGAWSLVGAGLGLMAVLDLGIGASLYRYFGVNGDARRLDSDRLLTSALLVLVCLAGILAVAGHVVAPLVTSVLHTSPENRPEISHLLSWAGAVLVLPVMAAGLGSRLQAAGEYAWLATAVAIGQCVYVGGLLLAHLRGDHLVAMLAALAAGLGVTGLVEAVAVRAVLGWRPLGAGLVRRSQLREVAAFAWAMQRAGFWALINLEADAIVVAAFLPLRLVGAYALGATVASGLRACVGSLLLPLLPPLSAAGGSPTESIAVATAVQRDWVRLAAKPASLCVPVAGVLAWSLGGGNRSEAALVAAVLALGHAFNLGTAVLSYWTRVVSRPDIEARYGRVSALVNVGLTLALVPWLGLFGVCVGTAVGQLTGSLWFVGTVRRWVQAPVPSFVRDVPWRSVLVATCVVGVASAAVMAVGLGPIAGLVIVAVVSGAVWLAPGLRGRTSDWSSRQPVPSNAASNME